MEKGKGVGKNREYRDPHERPTTQFLRQAGRVKTVKDLMIQEGKPRAEVNNAFRLPVSPFVSKEEADRGNANEAAADRAPAESEEPETPRRDRSRSPVARESSSTYAPVQSAAKKESTTLKGPPSLVHDAAQ